MNLIILPGNDISNKAWAKELSKLLKNNFGKVIIHNYRHWETKDKFVDSEYEMESIRLAYLDEKNYVVIAKSIGVILSLMSINNRCLHPKKMIHIGVPSKIVEDSSINLPKLYNRNPYRTLVIQNSDDPVGPLEKIRKLVDNKTDTYVLTTLTAGGHNYADFNLYIDTMINFLKN